MLSPLLDGAPWEQQDLQYWSWASWTMWNQHSVWEGNILNKEEAPTEAINTSHFFLFLTFIFTFISVFFICTPILQLLVLCELAFFQNIYFYDCLLPTPTLFFLLHLVPIDRIFPYHSYFTFSFPPFFPSPPYSTNYPLISVAIKTSDYIFPHSVPKCCYLKRLGDTTEMHRCPLVSVNTKAPVKALYLFPSASLLSSNKASERV